VNKQEMRTNANDWSNVDANTAFIKHDAAATGKPWFAYQGMDIVHPPYVQFAPWT
jgi:hypothetical protein